MKYKLINQPNENYSAKKQILINRGFNPKEIDHYYNLSDADINASSSFGEELMDAATSCFLKHLDADSTICVVVDCDCDGYTSSAILINYLWDLNSDFTEHHVHYYLHEGKQHGFSPGGCIRVSRLSWWIHDLRGIIWWLCGFEMV